MQSWILIYICIYFLFPFLFRRGRCITCLLQGSPFTRALVLNTSISSEIMSDCFLSLVISIFFPFQWPFSLSPPKCPWLFHLWRKTNLPWSQLPIQASTSFPYQKYLKEYIYWISYFHQTDVNRRISCLLIMSFTCIFKIKINYQHPRSPRQSRILTAHFDSSLSLTPYLSKSLLKSHSPSIPRATPAVLLIWRYFTSGIL